MKSEPRSEQQGKVRESKAANGSGANAIVNLSKLSPAELMALAQRRNKQHGLSGPDVLAPVFRGVVDTSSVRPPSVHPFTVGGGSRKDQYRGAWKALSKRIGVPLFSANDTEHATNATTNTNATTTAPRPEKEKPEPKAGGLKSGGGGGASATAAAAIGAVPTHAQLYGFHADHGDNKYVNENDKFVKLLGSWLGLAAPIDLPLLAPGAPPLLLKKLFKEVLEAGGAAAVSWPALAGRHAGDPMLAGVLMQVYYAYLAPAERRIASSAGGGAAAAGGSGTGGGGGKRTRAVRWEEMLNADVKRRAQLPEGTLPSIDKVRARIATARAAIRALEPSRPASAAAAAAAAQPDVEVAAAAAAAAAAPPPPSTLAADVLQAVRLAAARPSALLEGGGGSGGGKDAGGGKKRRASNASRRQSKGAAAAAAAAGSARKRARGSAAAADLEEGGGEAAAAAAEAEEVDVAAAVAADGEPLGNIEPRVAALLSVAASLKQTRAAPPGLASLPLPDLKTNFMARWEAWRAARAARDAAAAAVKAESDAAAAAAAAHGVARRGSDTGDAAAAAVGGSRKRQRKAEDGGAAGAEAAAKKKAATAVAAAAAADTEDDDPLISGPSLSRQSSQQLSQQPLAAAAPAAAATAAARPTNSGSVSGAEATGSAARGATAAAVASAPKSAVAGSGLPPLAPRHAVSLQPPVATAAVPMTVAAPVAADVATADAVAAAPAVGAVPGALLAAASAVEGVATVMPVRILGGPASAVSMAARERPDAAAAAAGEVPLANMSVEVGDLVEAAEAAGQL